MHPDTLLTFAREHLQDLLDESEARRRAQGRPSAARLWLARQLRGLAGRLDQLDRPAPDPARMARPGEGC